MDMTKYKLFIIVSGVALVLVVALTTMFSQIDTRMNTGPVEGPVLASVITVKDADSVAVLANPWPGDYKTTTIRVFGVDTPESGGRAKCEAERELAAKATAFAREQLQHRQLIELRFIDYDKYGERMVAEIWLINEKTRTNYGLMLITKGLAHEYYGGTKEGWCQ